MSALPALSLIATDLVRRQFAPDPPPREPAPPRLDRYRTALAALLDHAARVVAPVGATPAH